MGVAMNTLRGNQALSIRARVQRSLVLGWGMLAMTAALCVALTAPASAAKRVGGARGVVADWAVQSPGGRQIGIDHDGGAGFRRKIGVDHDGGAGLGRKFGLDVRTWRLVLPFARKVAR